MGHNWHMSGVIAVRLRVIGLVQGVGFRYSCLHRAGELGVSGWVRNEGDGSVGVHAEGEPDAVAAMVAWCREGPPWGSVERVEQRLVPAEGMRGFRVR
ncbi:acylphosphatase [Brooklawnia cerclae]